MDICWDKKYEIGHARIDFEHRIFLDLLVSFYDKLMQGASKEQLLRVLREIFKYADFHFTSEENVMEDCDYPDRAEHAKLHAILLGELRDLTGQFSKEQIPAEKPFEFLFNWFALHTTQVDKRLAAYIDTLAKRS